MCTPTSFEKNMTTQLTVRVVRSIHNTPLMELNGGPFNGTELTPHQMRFLASTLAGVADAVDEENVNARGWRPRTIRLSDVLGDKAPKRKGVPA